MTYEPRPWNMPLHGSPSQDVLPSAPRQPRPSGSGFGLPILRTPLVRQKLHAVCLATHLVARILHPPTAALAHTGETPGASVLSKAFVPTAILVFRRAETTCVDTGDVVPIKELMLNGTLAAALVAHAHIAREPRGVPALLLKLFLM